MTQNSLLEPLDTFVHRHIGPSEADVEAMLDVVGVESLDALTDETVPCSIRLDRSLDLGPARGENELLEELRRITSKNRVARSFIGQGYYGCITPPVIQRNILENPGWYTQYTPYQAEISQGRLEALLVFQTMVSDLCALPIANASLLDEGTAAAEAMAMCYAAGRKKKTGFFIAGDCHPQTVAVIEGRAKPIGVKVDLGSLGAIDFDNDNLCGVLLQCPSTDGRIFDYSDFVRRAHDAGALVVVATDLLALTLMTPPGELGADIAIGSSQRFGVPMGFGGPHAAFLATTEKYVRQLPGRLIGVSRDARGASAFRMALQTREQHIRRDRATSNICTAQVLLAIMAGMYAVYHGPDGLRRIANRIRTFSEALAAGLTQLGADILVEERFDTLRFWWPAGGAVLVEKGHAVGLNLRLLSDDTVGISVDETFTRDDLTAVLALAGDDKADAIDIDALLRGEVKPFSESLTRTSDFLTHEVFHRYHAEHEMLRYLNRLQSRDLSLVTSMIPLGSCTMKLNGTSEMIPISWPEISALHPFVPREQAAGYYEIFEQLSTALEEITGFDAFSLQPNAGSQGELSGLLVIRAYHDDRGESHRNACLIPLSAHGTNAASAVMAGFKVVPVKCDDRGNIDLDDLAKQAADHRDDLAALMITYPSTHGVFEAEVKQICQTVHEYGGQVYMDGANMNAQVGFCRPADIGADVCHLNLHKTFSIPHGGGGPGVGPIGVVRHLADFLPGHPVIPVGGDKAIEPIAAAPWGSPSILPISWMYIRLMGTHGLQRATQIAILNANYMAARLQGHYEVLYTGESGRVAHEFIIDIRPFKASTGVEAEDIAKRLIDYGFHAPTMSFPVPGTLMIEPTESESRWELDRFCDAMLSIREEIRAIEEGRSDREDNPLKNAPHTADVVSATEWGHPYPREEGAYPVPRLREFKFWPPVARIDNVYGDRNLICRLD